MQFYNYFHPIFIKWSSSNEIYLFIIKVPNFHILLHTSLKARIVLGIRVHESKSKEGRKIKNRVNPSVIFIYYSNSVSIILTHGYNHGSKSWYRSSTRRVLRHIGLGVSTWYRLICKLK